jgi:hypothetical protein
MSEAEHQSDRRLEHLAAREEIREVVYRFCRGIDRRQWDLIRDCYHPGGVDWHGPYVGGVEGFIDQMKSSLDMFEHMYHFVGNILIDFDGDYARVESCVMISQRIPADDSPARDLVIGGRYVDDFAKRDGRWRITHRVCIVDWSRIDPVAAADYSMMNAFCAGRRDSSDAVFADHVGDLQPTASDAGGVMASAFSAL